MVTKIRFKMQIVLKNNKNFLYETSPEEMQRISNAWRKAFLYEFGLGNWSEWLDMEHNDFIRTAKANFYIKNCLHYLQLGNADSMYFFTELKRCMKCIKTKANNEKQWKIEVFKLKNTCDSKVVEIDGKQYKLQEV